MQEISGETPAEGNGVSIHNKVIQGEPHHQDFVFNLKKKVSLILGTPNLISLRMRGEVGITNWTLNLIKTLWLLAQNETPLEEGAQTHSYTLPKILIFWNFT